MKIYVPDASMEWPISTPEDAERWLMDIGLDQFDIQTLANLLSQHISYEYDPDEIRDYEDALDERDEEISNLQHRIVKLEQKLKELEA